MGVFSTKKKKKFFTAVQRMISDEDIVLSSKAGVTNWLFTPQGGSATSLNAKGLPDFLIEAGMSSLPNKFKRAYRFADKGKYAYGLPKAASYSRDAVDIEVKIKEAIELDLGHSVNMLYADLGEATYYHFMWKLLIDTYGYNPTTNELETLSLDKGFPCYLKTGQLIFTSKTVDGIIDSTYLEQKGFSTESGKTDDRVQDLNRPLIDYVLDEAATTDVARITYCYTEIIPDTTPPDAPVISDFDGIVLKGIAEKLSTVYVYDGTTEIGSVLVNTDGTFELNLASEILTEISIRAKDTSDLESDLISITAPYTAVLTVTEGADPTQTVFKREETFDLTFEAYIDEAPEDFVEVPEGEEVIDDTLQAPDINYVMAAYTYDNAGTTEIKYLTYAYESNTRPEFEDLIESSSAAGEFFPRLYARLDKVKLNTLPKTDPRYKSSERLAKLLGIDWSGWVDTVHASIESVEDVQQMFITECAPMNTTDPIIAQYLFHYFLKIYTELPDIPTGYVLPFTEAFDIKPGLALGIKDSVYEHGIGFDGVGYKTLTGNIGATGTFKVDFIPSVMKKTFLAGINPRYKLIPITLPYHSIKFQVSATEYKEIRVFNMASRHNFGGNGTTVSGADEAVVIPLDRSALPFLNTNEREILFGKCLYMFINIVKIIKTKWYQRGAFKVLMAVVAIAFAVVTVGAGAPISAYIFASAMALTVGFAINLAIGLLAKVLVKLGVDVGIVTAITAVLVVLAIFAGANGVNVGNITPQALLQVTNAGFQTAARMNGIALGIIMKAMEAFNTTMKNQQQLLDEAQKMLDSGTIPLSIDVLLGDLRSRVMISVGESVDMFFSRTVGLGNLASIPAELTSAYVDVALTLPDAHTMLKRMKEN